MEWKQVEQNWVLTPIKPQGVIHFLGGAFVATAPHVSYSRLLEKLANQGYVIVATPFINTFDHKQIAIDVHKSFQKVRNKLFLDYFPVFGLGHSMGCKVHLLVNSLFEVKRAGNIFIAYNNYNASRSIPFFKELSGTIPEMAGMEFVPSPTDTIALIEANYQVPHNLLVRFFNDDIDEIPILAKQLERKFANTVKVQALPGNHLTCLGGDFKWQAGNTFTPFDALGQWVRQGVYKDSQALEQVVLRWLQTTNVKPQISAS